VAWSAMHGTLGASDAVVDEHVAYEWQVVEAEAAGLFACHDRDRRPATTSCSPLQSAATTTAASSCAAGRDGKARLGREIRPTLPAAHRRTSSDALGCLIAPVGAPRRTVTVSGRWRSPRRTAGSDTAADASRPSSRSTMSRPSFGEEGTEPAQSPL
jgi:hypothetical protein